MMLHAKIENLYRSNKKHVHNYDRFRFSLAHLNHSEVHRT